MTENSKTGPRPPPDQRIAWVDHSKGFCILMVLLLHAHQEITELLGSGGWVNPIVAFAKPFRMPDFFMIAGLFLSQVINRSWREYVDRKVWHFIYFYVLWSGIHFVLFGIKTALNDSGGDWSTVLPAYLLTYINPSSSLWFIHSLALFFLITRLCRQVPWWLMLSVAALLQMSDVNTGWMAIDQFCKRFVFFYSGYLLAGPIFQLAEWIKQRPLLAWAYLLCWAFINQWLVWAGWADKQVISLVLGYYGASAVIMLSALLSTMTWTGALAYLGKYSIVLYLSDYVVQRVVLKLHYTQLPLDNGSLTFLLAAISVCGSLILFRIAQHTRMAFLYQRPAWSRLTSMGLRPRLER